jgi:hypothetical protein
MTVVTEKAMLAKLKISRWAASKHDKKISADVAAQHGADPTMGRYSKRLVAKERLETIAQIATRARHHHYENTLPWLDDGARILPAANYFDYMAQQNTFRAEFEQAVSAFEKEYPAVVDEARRALNGLFNEDDYPPPDRLRDKFAMQVDVDPMPTAEDFRVALSEDENARIRESIQGRLDDAVQGAINDVWHRVHDTVAKMVERLRAYEVDAEGKVHNAFRDSLVGNIRALSELLPKLNITNSDALEVMRQRLADELCSFDAPVLREDPTLRNEIAANAEAILADIKDLMA